MMHPVHAYMLDKIAKWIIDTILLPMLPEERVHLLGELICNGIFCEHCGIGTVDRPNTNCQCWNDE